MKQTRHLGSYTIIPQNLYVERAADAQLAGVIRDMGRPAYVLVARQMGKTNLLLNARRQFTSDDIFLYLDVSNLFPDAESFLRNVVDTALSLSSKARTSCEDVILRRRSSPSKMPAHKEHEFELLQILGAIGGRFVVCFDEIDALTNTAYSDQIFAFIRSIYFSGRANFPAFERLTYVLSGVAEPTEIIKNKDISPFNIGEKILLDDFTQGEFKDFLLQANLQLGESVAGRIFDWTSGNPRMSWDICAALEQLTLSGELLTDGIVDQIVKRVYLTNFDMPPIDHIRSLVENEADIRDALVSLHYGKGAAVHASTRNKLYLAGAVRFLPDGSVIIRNRILTEALSEKWLMEVENRKLSIYERANKRFKEEQWEHARTLYSQYLRSTVEEKVDAAVFYRLGLCHFRIGDWATAIECFLKRPFSPEGVTQPFFYAQQYHLGCCYFETGQDEKAVGCFRRVLEQDANSPDSVLLLDATLDLSSVLLTQSAGSTDSEIRQLCQSILDHENFVVPSRSGAAASHSRYLASAHLNLARMYERRGDSSAAVSELDRASEYAEDRWLVGLLLRKARLVSGQNAQAEVLTACVDSVVAKNLQVSAEDATAPLNFTTKFCYEIVGRLGALSLWVLLDKFLDHLLSLQDQTIVGPRAAILSLGGMYARQIGFPEAGAELLRRGFLTCPPSEDWPERRFYATFALIGTPSNRVDALERLYVAEFLTQPNAELIDSDFRVLAGLVLGHLEKEAERADDLLKRAYRLLPDYLVKGSETVPRDGRFASLILDYLQLEVDLRLGKVADLVDRANLLIAAFVKNGDAVPPILFPEDYGAVATRRLKEILRSAGGSKLPFTVGKKYGRNEIVRVRLANGELKEGKFKKLQADIDAGRAVLVVEEDRYGE